MRLAVLGGTGRIGRLVVEQALAAGHEVTILVRDRSRLPSLEDRALLHLVDGDVRNADAVARVVGRADAVISALGPNGNTPDQVDLLREAMSITVQAMRRLGVARIVNLSGAAVDAPGDQKPLLDRVASRIVRHFARHIVAAKQAEFDVLRASGLEWVAARPPLVTDGPRTGRYRVGLDILRPGGRISRADIADFMLAQAGAMTYAGQAPFVLY